MNCVVFRTKLRFLPWEYYLTILLLFSLSFIFHTELMKAKAKAIKSCILLYLLAWREEEKVHERHRSIELKQ